MSDDPPQPDLTVTAEVPLSGLPAGTEIGPTPPADREPDGGEALFSTARPLELVSTSTDPTDDPSILEDSARPFSERLTPLETIGRLKTFVETGRDRAEPLYRRQGTLAVLALCVLAVVAVISFPRSRTEAVDGNGVAVTIRSVERGPAGPTSDGNADGAVNHIGTDRWFAGTKAVRSQGETGGPSEGPSSSTSSAQRSRTSIRLLPTLGELTETSVGSDQPPTDCQGPGATTGCNTPPPPDQTIPTSAPPSSAASTVTGGGTAVSTTSSTVGGAATTARTTTTGTTARSTTTTTGKPTTTRPSSTSTTTTRPSSTTTTRPSSTSTTSKPTTTRPTSTASTASTTGSTGSPSTVTTSPPPSESPNPPPPVVACGPPTIDCP